MQRQVVVSSPTRGPHHPIQHPSEAATTQKQFRRRVLMLWEILIFPPAVEVLSRDTEVYPKDGDKKEPAETKEEAAGEDGEDNSQAGLYEQGTVPYLE